jgi:hypothetical protein
MDFCAGMPYLGCTHPAAPNSAHNVLLGGSDWATDYASLRSNAVTGYAHLERAELLCAAVFAAMNFSAERKMRTLPMVSRQVRKSTKTQKGIVRTLLQLPSCVV